MRGSGGKKVKRNKGTVLDLNTFLGDAPQGTINVVKKISNNDDDYSDDDYAGGGGGNSKSVVMQLPTAPKAQRVFDDESIPHKPPFLVRISNLPFDANEDDVYDLFGNITAKSVILPRDDGETGRLRGYGKVELETRDDLIHMLSLPEPTIRGRRIRIELFNQSDNYGDNRFGGTTGGGAGGRRNYNNFGNTDTNRESTNWRQDSAIGGVGTGGSNAWQRNSPEAPSTSNRNTQWTSQRSSASSSWKSNRDDEDNGSKQHVSSNWRQDKTDVSSSNVSWRTGGGNARNTGENTGDFSAWRDNNDGNRRRNYGRNGSSPNRERTTWQHGRRSPNDERNAAQANLHDDAERPRLNLLPRQLPLPKIITSGDENSAKINEELKDCAIVESNATIASSSSTAVGIEADSGNDSDEAVAAV